MTTTTKRGVGRPKLPEADRKVYINFTATRQVRDILAQRAKRAKLSRAKLLTQLIQGEESNSCVNKKTRPIQNPSPLCSSSL